MIFSNVHLLIISKYVISEKKDQTFNINVFKSLKKIKISEKVHVFLFDDESFNLIFDEENDDKWIVVLNEESVLKKYLNDFSINVSEFKWKFLTC